MSERFNDQEKSPCLTGAEIRTLADMAYEYGETYEANHLDIQDPTRPRPYFYRLTIPPHAINPTWRMRPNDESEVITEITIEYNDPMVIQDDQELMDSWVTVSVTTKAYDAEFDEGLDRHIRYRFSLTPGRVCEAAEDRSDENKRADIVVNELEDALPILAEEARPLNDDDLQFLRLLISPR